MVRSASILAGEFPLRRRHSGTRWRQLTANLDGGGWMELKKSPELADRMFGWKDLPRSVGEMSNEEFGARVLHHYYACVSEMAGEHCRILDYRNIDADQVKAVAAFFGMELPGSGHQIERILGVYSKDPSGAQPFQPDGPRKQKLATGLVRSAAYRWATAAYNDLSRAG